MFTLAISIMNLNLLEFFPVLEGFLYGVGGGLLWELIEPIWSWFDLKKHY